MFGIANVVGPIMGGAITQYLNWRWCFWINLPCGVAVAVVLFFLLNSPTRLDTQLRFPQKLHAFDLPSTAISFLLLRCFFWHFTGPALAFPGTGFSRHWLFVALFTGYWSSLRIYSYDGSVWCLAVERRDSASIPPRLIRQRNVMCSAIVAFIAMGSL